MGFVGERPKIMLFPLFVSLTPENISGGVSHFVVYFFRDT